MKKFSDNLIIDETQNMIPNQVKGIITRSGQGTKIILPGDHTPSAEECERSVLAMDAVKRL